ncbi:hypothetical protein GDO78_002045 [Eleutherodactylus coqui]|uniref:Uncharacterized protein n=1 Tax=Eleutherodactylus coqui TaxID=57060 RepID=A0A8J6FWZ1_ELECQ|nr:hypothetical protein GDO78_002045 [Eleutherodactylus coqui]
MTSCQLGIPGKWDLHITAVHGPRLGEPNTEQTPSILSIGQSFTSAHRSVQVCWGVTRHKRLVIFLSRCGLPTSPATNYGQRPPPTRGSVSLSCETFVVYFHPCSK